jgi:hypothetical protein
MHWLLLLAVLSSTTSLKNGGSTSSLNRLAENALRKQLGGTDAVRQLRVSVTPGKGGRGDFDAFNVSLDGFSADRLMNLADNADDSFDNNNTPRRDSLPEDYGYDQLSTRLSSRSANAFDLGDILKDRELGNVLGGILSGKGGRIGKIRLRATNFTFGGARYDSLDADLGEVRFDWAKALRGQFDIKSVQPGTLGLQLHPDQAARLLGPRLPSISDLKVRFSSGRAFIGGRSNFYGVRVPFEVGAQLSVQQNQVRAEGIRASVARLRLPSFVMNELTKGVNPLYDFDPKNRWPLAINLNTAGTQNNVLALRGGIRWLGFGRNRDTSSRNTERRNDSRSGDYYPEGTSSRNDERPRRSTGDILGDILGN